MAELAEQKLEEMIQELEQIKRVKLFTPAEATDILKRRREFEYATLKREKRIKDFQAYISYEIGLLGLLKIRRKKLGYPYKKDEIEKPIMSRLVRLHKQICNTFKGRLDLWMACIRLCEQLNRPLTVSRLWTLCLQFNPCTDARLWSSAAHWHLHDRPASQARQRLKGIYERKRNVDKAKRSGLSFDCTHEELDELRKSLCREEQLVFDQAIQDGMRDARYYLTQGLKNMPDSQHIYIELLKVELLHAHFLDFRQKRGALELVVEEDLSRILDGTTANLIITDALEKWPLDSNMFKQMIELFDQFVQPLFPHLHNLLKQKFDEFCSHSVKATTAPNVTFSSPSTRMEDNITQRLSQLHETALTGGLAAVELLWNQWCSAGSQSSVLFHAVITLAISALQFESEQSRPNRVKHLRREFDRGVGNWGASNPDFWIDYIRFEEEFGDPLQVSELDWRARNTLKPATLVADFVFKRNYKAI